MASQALVAQGISAITSPDTPTPSRRFSRPLPPICLLTKSRFNASERKELSEHLSTVSLALDSLSLLSTGSTRSTPRYKQKNVFKRLFSRKAKTSVTSSLAGNELLAIWMLGMLYILFLTWRLRRSPRDAALRTVASGAGLMLARGDPKWFWLAEAVKSTSWQTHLLDQGYPKSGPSYSKGPKQQTAIGKWFGKKGTALRRSKRKLDWAASALKT